MSKFSDLPENATPSEDDIIAIEQDSDGLNRKVKFSNLPIIADLASQASGKGASLVGVEDVAGNFTATTVEGVLAELHAMLDGLDPWVSGTTYTAGEDAVILTDNNVIYRCTTTNSDVTFNPANWQAVGKDVHTIADDNATGSNVTLTAPTTDLIRLVNASLVSIDMIPAGETGNPIWLINDTGVSVTINDETGGTPANSIKTGTGKPLTMEDQSSIQVIYDSTDSRWQVVGGTGSGEGGGGGLDVFDTETFEDVSYVVNAEGNNATFLGGGTIDGSGSLETTSPISGSQSYKYTAGSSSLNDYQELKVIDLDLKQRSADIKTRLSCDMSGFDNDVTFVIYDKTNNNVLSSSLDLLKASTSRSFYEFSVFVPSNCEQISYGIHVNIGAINTESLLIDDIEWSTNPFITKNLLDRQSITFSGNASSHLDNNEEQRYDTTTLTIKGDSIIAPVDDAGNTRTNFTALRKCTVDISAGGGVSGTNSFVYIRKNGTTICSGSHIRTSGDSGTVSVEVDLEKDDYITVGFSPSSTGSNTLSIQAEADSEHIITPAKSNTETYRANDATIYASNNTALPYFTTISENTISETGILTNDSTDGFTFTATEKCIVTMSHRFGSTSASYAGISKNATPSELDTSIESISAEKIVALSFTTTSGVVECTYTGVLEVGDSLAAHLSTGETVTGNAYDQGVTLIVTKFDASFLSAIPVQKVAYLKEESLLGVSSSSNTVYTRDLNSVYGDTEIVSLSAGQFTLASGKYDLEYFGYSYQSNYTSVFLYNVTDGEYVTTNQPSDYNFSSDSQSKPTHGSDLITITSSKTYELRQYINNGAGAGGLGNNGYSSTNNPATTNVHAQVKITKLR